MTSWVGNRKAKSHVFQPLVVKKAEPIARVSDEFYDIAIHSHNEINKKCKDFSDALTVKKQQLVQHLAQSKLSHQKTLELLEQEIQESEQWKMNMRSLQEYIQTNSSSESLHKFVKKELTSIDDRKHGTETSKISFTQWKMEILGNFDQKLVEKSKQLAFSLTDFQLVFAFFQQFPDLSRGIKHLPVLIAKIEQFQQSLSTLIESTNGILSKDTNEKGVVEALEKNVPQLEQKLNEGLMIYLDPDWINRCRELAEKGQECIDEIRLREQMSSAALAAMQKFPYIGKAQSMAMSVRALTVKSSSALSAMLSQHQPQQGRPDLLTQWQAIVDSVRNPSRLVKDNNGTDSSKKIPLYELSTLIINWSNFLLQLSSTNDFQLMISQSIDLCCEKYSASSSEEDARYGAVLIYGIFRLLTKRAKDEFIKILQGKVFKHSLLIPNFIQSEQSLSRSGPSDSNSPGLKQQSDFAFLLGAIVGYSADNMTNDMNGPLDAAFGWTFLVRAAQQLHYIAHIKSATQGAVMVETVSIETSCLIIYQFLQTCGRALFTSYQCKFEELLRGLEQTITNISITSSGVQNLRELIRMALKDRNMQAIFYNNQDPAVVNFTLLAGTPRIAGERFEELLKHKDGPFAMKYKELQLGRTRAIFNRISATEESQQRACSQIIDKIKEGSATGDHEILRFTLHKVIDGLLEAIQEESFSNINESQTLMFARVACMVCRDISDLGHLLRGLFYNTCPPIMPKVVSEGISEDEFLRSVGFRWKPVKGSDETKPENLPSWLLRMQKVTTVVAVMSIQPEQVPFKIEDMWALLSRMTNYATSLRTLPFYLPSIYNIVLRITSPKLVEKFGQRYLRLVRLINEHIFPKMDEDAEKGRLKSFLDKFLHSNGTDCEKYFLHH